MSHWEKARLSSVTTKVGSGSTPRGGKNAYKESGLPLIRSMNVHFDGFKRDGLAFIDDKQASKLNNVIVEENDVLLNITGASIGRVTTAPKDMEGARVNQHVSIIRPDSHLDSRFLSAFLSAPEQQALINNIQVGATRQALTKSMILDFEVPLPPLPEQRRIVSKIEELFSKLDAGVAALKQAKAQLKRYRQSVLAAAVTGELTKEWRANNPNTEPASKLLARILKQRREQWNGRGKYSEPSSPQKLAFQLTADSWAHVSIDQLSIDTTIGLVRSASLQNSNGIGTAYLKMDKVDMDGGINLEGLVYVDATTEEIKRFALRKGDVLFNTRNSVELVGKTGYLNSDPEFPIVYNNNLMRIRFIEAALPAFVALQMCSKPFREKMEEAKRATTSVAAIYGKDLRPLPIALPPLEEQKQIIAEVEARTTTIDHIEAELDQHLTRSNKLRQAILSSAFTGNLR